MHFPIISMLNEMKELSKPYVLDILFTGKKHKEFYREILRRLPIVKTEFADQLYIVWIAVIALEAVDTVLGTSKYKKLKFHWR